MIEFESGMLEYSTCVCTAALSGSVMEASVEVLEDVGDARSIWAAVPLQSEGGGGLLLLGAYGPPPGHGVGVRRAFWLARLHEWRLLQNRPRFRGWALVVASDFNLHFSALGGINARLEERLDREVWRWMQDLSAFGVVARSPVGQRRTHLGL